MAEFHGYRITSPYGYRTHPIRGGTREFHAGVDLAKTHKSPIYAFTQGTVIYAGLGKNGTGLGGYGNVVLIRDNNNRAQLYAHLDSAAVTKGRVVKKGQNIGYQGRTGFVTGSHLHYEIRKKVEITPPYGYRSNKQTSTVNPIAYLNQFKNSEYLKDGDQGNAVKKLQSQLVKLGFRLDRFGQDGIFEKETEKAVKAFQVSQNIKADGTVSPVTSSKLEKASTLVANYRGLIKRGSKGEIVRIIQRKVGTKVDGIFGPKTENAVKHYQQRHNLKVDGIVGPKTWQQLF
ncbi:membrane protein related to metalloendopeptidase [Gracilibacillus boraciitolerans JCM 21714]|uniref:Membrane protein related to metalloendopeptidase n=1 Tax=Gracilibacillus boraciitolerans JCM 21714 TaxID=1298598 RepID=W4VP76_9BACI|nr:peptidoglycan-binding protein [Gracilibacillus boraciitolerans]GAE95190.1 membrane protein related to metalloendopeptidase [Gracilibacillus boraciitolerans JCM 21714]